MFIHVKHSSHLVLSSSFLSASPLSCLVLPICPVLSSPFLSSSPYRVIFLSLLPFSPFTCPLLPVLSLSLPTRPLLSCHVLSCSFYVLPHHVMYSSVLQSPLSRPSFKLFKLFLKPIYEGKTTEICSVFTHLRVI